MRCFAAVFLAEPSVIPLVLRGTNFSCQDLACIANFIAAEMPRPLVVALFCALSALSFCGSATVLADKPKPQVTQTKAPQKDVFGYLSEKVGRQIALPEVPANALVAWSLQSYETAGKDPTALYSTIYEQLLVAQNLLAEKNPQQKRRGLRLVHNANFKAAVRLRDTSLCAQLFDAFILPNVEAATPGRGTLSRARLLQDAASAYRLAGQPQKQADALRRLITVSEKDKDTDGADWARVKLSDVLAAGNQYAEAIEHLKAVTSANMSGSKRRIPDLEAKAKKAQEQQESTQTNTQE